MSTILLPSQKTIDLTLSVWYDLLTWIQAFSTTRQLQKDNENSSDCGANTERNKYFYTVFMGRMAYLQTLLDVKIAIYFATV